MSILILDGEEATPHQLLRHERRCCCAITCIQVRIASGALNKFDANLGGSVLIENGLDDGDTVLRDLRIFALVLKGNIPTGWPECNLGGAGDTCNSFQKRAPRFLPEPGQDALEGGVELRQFVL